MVSTNKSTLLVGATGAGKSVSDSYILHNFLERYPNAEIWAISQKNDSFNGLDRRGRVIIFDATNPKSSFTPIDKLWEIYEQRRQTREKDRDFRKHPVRLKIADWHSIYISCRTEKWFPPYLQKLSVLVTVGREFNIALLIDSQSFNLSALGLTEDSNIRLNLNILAQAYSWKDSNGNMQGDYGVLTNLINNRYVVPDREIRAQLNKQLKELKSQNMPTLFSANEPPSLALVPDIRHYKNSADVPKKDNTRETLERLYQLEASEPPNRPPEPPNRLLDADCEEIPNQFTKLELSFEEAKAMVARLRAKGMNQKKIIKILWDANSGESKAFKKAFKEFKQLEND